MPSPTDLRLCLQDILSFVIEQIELARSPTDQFAAVDTAQGVIPYLWSRLKEDKALQAKFLLVLGDHIEPAHWKHVWAQMATEPPDAFARSADDMVTRLNALKQLVAPVC
jgi:hypothetical protein